MPEKENMFVELRWLIIGVLLSAAILAGMHYYRSEIEMQIMSAETDTAKYMATINQAQEMQRQLRERLKNSALPSQITEIDSIQNKFLEKMRLSGISIESITRVPATPQGNDSPAPNGVEFNMTINGEWGAVMLFLNGMQKDTTLINLRQIVMEPETNSNLIKTVCRYKIYVEM